MLIYENTFFIRITDNDGSFEVISIDTQLRNEYSCSYELGVDFEIDIEDQLKSLQWGFVPKVGECYDVSFVIKVLPDSDFSVGDDNIDIHINELIFNKR